MKRKEVSRTGANFVLHLHDKFTQKRNRFNNDKFPSSHVAVPSEKSERSNFCSAQKNKDPCRRFRAEALSRLHFFHDAMSGFEGEFELRVCCCCCSCCRCRRVSTSQQMLRGFPSSKSFRTLREISRSPFIVAGQTYTGFVVYL